jgi:hypothetical protein
MSLAEAAAVTALAMRRDFIILNSHFHSENHPVARAGKF